MANKPRGRSALSFHVSNLGFAPGETLPSGTVQPQPIYPVSTTYISIFICFIFLLYIFFSCLIYKLWETFFVLAVSSPFVEIFMPSCNISLTL